ncbi:HNH endonuclease signature motif containing protein [soil metagenome]
MATERDALRGIIDALAALPVPGAGQLSDAQMCAWTELVERAGRHVDALRVAAAGEIADRSRRELGSASLARQHGSVSGAALLEKLTRTSAADAARRIRLAADTAPRLSLAGEPLPARFDGVATALRSGEIGVDAALTIVRNVGAARTASIEQIEAAEHLLVDEARHTSADLIGVQARAWRSALDPDGSLDRDRELRGRRRFVLGREVDGMTPFWGEADPVSASQLRTWLSERTAPDRLPRFLADDDPALEDGGASFARGSAVGDDPRTREQRSFDVLMGLLQAGVRADATVTTPVHSAANVMVVVRESDLERGTGTAWLSDVTEPISAATAGVLACEAGIQRITLDAFGQPLALGVRERYFTARQRKALAVRDGGCAWPSCTAPPAWTHAHHIRQWSQGGTTDIDNGVLLCAFHHHLLHDGEFQIRMVDGRPHLLSPPRLDITQTWQPMGRPRIPMLPERAAA